MAQANTYSPKLQVLLRRAENDFQPEDISSDVIQVNTSKVYAAAAGGFQIFTTFKRSIQDKRYDEVVKPDDIVLISFDNGAGAGMKPVMLGLIDRAAETCSFDQDGRPLFRCRLTGQDFGKYLIKHNIAFDIAAMETQIGDEATNRLIGAQPDVTLFTGTPSAIVKRIADSLLFKQVPRTVLWMDTDWVTSDDEWELFDLSLLTRTGPVWGAMKTAANEPWNTLYCDTGLDGKFHLGLERTPFDATTGTLLRDNFHTIEGVDIENIDLGVTDNERVNYIFYDTPVSSFGESANTFMSLSSIKYDAVSAKTHGFHPIYPKTEFSPFGKKKIAYITEYPDVRENLKKRTETLWTWFSGNHSHESGMVKIHGRAEIRAGDGCVIPDRQKQYLIQQVDHLFRVGNNVTFSTTLELARGLNHVRR